jgi:hypothetical protein
MFLGLPDPNPDSLVIFTAPRVRIHFLDAYQYVTDLQQCLKLNAANIFIYVKVIITRNHRWVLGNRV